MNDQSNYEFWDYRSKETPQQFRAFKEVRKVLGPYENYFNGLIEGLDVAQMANKGKSKDKFETKVKDGESITVMQLKGKRIKNSIKCKEVWIKYSDDAWTLIEFNEGGQIKEIRLNETQQHNPIRTTVLTDSLNLGKPNIGIGHDPKDYIFPVKEIELYTENPEDLGWYAYASYSGGQTWRQRIDSEGKVEGLKISFPEFVVATFKTVLPEPVRQSIALTQ